MVPLADLFRGWFTQLLERLAPSSAEHVADVELAAPLDLLIAANFRRLTAEAVERALLQVAGAAEDTQLGRDLLDHAETRRDWAEKNRTIDKLAMVLPYTRPRPWDGVEEIELAPRPSNTGDAGQRLGRDRLRRELADYADGIDLDAAMDERGGDFSWRAHAPESLLDAAEDADGPGWAPEPIDPIEQARQTLTLVQPRMGAPLADLRTAFPPLRFFYANSAPQLSSPWLVWQEFPQSARRVARQVTRVEDLLAEAGDSADWIWGLMPPRALPGEPAPKTMAGPVAAALLVLRVEPSPHLQVVLLTERAAQTRPLLATLAHVLDDLSFWLPAALQAVLADDDLWNSQEASAGPLWTVESAGPCLYLSAAPRMLALFARAMVRLLHQRREEGFRLMARDRLAEVARGLRRYALMHQGWLPETLGDLLRAWEAAGEFSAPLFLTKQHPCDRFLSPTSRQLRPHAADDLSTDAQADWVNRHADFAFPAAGKKLADLPRQQILAYERPTTYHRDGIHIATVGGGIRFVALAEAHRLLANAGIDLALR